LRFHKNRPNRRLRIIIVLKKAKEAEQPTQGGVREACMGWSLCVGVDGWKKS